MHTDTDVRALTRISSRSRSPCWVGPASHILCTTLTHSLPVLEMDHMNTRVLGVILYMCKYLYMSTADSRWQENAVGVPIQTLAA